VSQEFDTEIFGQVTLAKVSPESTWHPDSSLRRTS